MRHSNLLAAGLAFVLFAGLTNSRAEDQEEAKKKEKNSPASPGSPARPPQRSVYPNPKIPLRPQPKPAPTVVPEKVTVPERAVAPEKTTIPERVTAPHKDTFPQKQTSPVVKEQPKQTWDVPKVQAPPKPAPAVAKDVWPEKPMTKDKIKESPAVAKDPPRKQTAPVTRTATPTVAKTPLPPLQTQKTADGGYQKVTPTGKVRERMETKRGGEKQVQEFNATGRIEKQIVTTRDKKTRATTYDLGKREKKIEVVDAKGNKEVTDILYNRNGEVRARETLKTDASGKVVSKTVIVKNNLTVNNTIVNKDVTVVNRTTVVEHRREYVPCRYGYVYSPVVAAPIRYAAWYDPFWYAPPLVVGGPLVSIRTHSFSFSWGWTAEPWYVCHRAYWQPYPVYVGPSYWVTDWMVAGYLADRYATAVSVEQARREVELAREEAQKANEAAQQALAEAEKAKLAAQQARDEAEKTKLLAQQTALETELNEARRLQNDAEDRAQKAEARAEKAEAAEAKQKELAGKPNPNATPIDQNTKETLKDQIEKTIAEKKAFAENSTKGGNPVPPDISQALADPKHIYPVSKTISVVLAKDSSPAGILTIGDLMKVEPGQDLKNLTATSFVTMRVMTSKGEEGEVAAGSLVSVSMMDLQEFDNEFRAKLDQALEEADKNKEQFKQLAQK